MKKFILAVDIGNTSAHFALCSEAGKVLKEFRVATPDIASRARQAIQKNIPSKSSVVVLVATVVPEAGQSLKKIVANQLKLPVFIIGKDIKVPIVNRYKNPAQVGIDRLLNAYAGYSLFKKELIIIDFGTAITFDLVSAKGEYLGGIIAPGIIRVSMPVRFF